MNLYQLTNVIFTYDYEIKWYFSL